MPTPTKHSPCVGIRTCSDYSPFGVELDGRTVSGGYRFGFQNQEKDDEIKGEGNSVNYTFRMHDPRLGRWLSKDPFEVKYPELSPYTFVANTPLQAIDPDGKRIYFVAGAGGDTQGWKYTERWGKAFEKSGIKGFKAIKGVSHDKPGSFPTGDIMFTTEHSKTSTESVPASYTNKGDVLTWKLEPVDDRMIEKAVEKIMDDLAKNPLEIGEQLNLAGYSYGSVLQAHVALKLSEKGIIVDNLVLIGSPIPTDSELYNKLEKITNVSRVDIPGDKLSNPESVLEYYQGAYENSADGGHHFDLARPDNLATKKVDEVKLADQKIQLATDTLKKKGIK